jgi:hypothetical protein
LSLSAFERTARQIAEEERQLRLLAEERLRDYARLALELASVFLAAELDARTRADPYFLSRATAADWRSLLQAAQRWQLTQATGWSASATADGETERWRSEALRWQAEAQQLHAEVGRLQDELTALTTRPAPAAVQEAVPPVAGDPTSATPIRAEAPPVLIQAGNALPPLTKPRPPTVAPAAHGSAISLPPMPALAPGRFADQLRNWPRESLALCALGVTGWSMRQAIAELLSARLGDVQPNAGSLRRLFTNLARRGFWREEKVVVNGVRRPEAGLTDTGGPSADAEPDAGDATTLILVHLTELGRDVLRACGVQPAPSEWERLLATHGGSAQIAHAGVVCAVAYHARRRGYATTVCPEVTGSAAPDVQVSRNDESLYVEIEDTSGSSERRLRKWRNQAALQGRAALVAVTPAARTNLVNEARAAGCTHGVATDLQTLMETQETGGPLWAVEW